MLIPLPDLLSDAICGTYAVGYFEAWDSYSLEAVVEAAEAEKAPVILGFGCMMTDPDWMIYMGIDALGRLGSAAAERCTCPTALILNESKSLDQALRGLDAGFTVAMLDTSKWGRDDAARAVADLVSAAHARGVAVEAEVGSLPDATGDGIDTSHAALTDPDDAARFADETGVDCLAVSIGNVHLLSQGLASVDLDRLRRIHDRVGIPLVIHGGTGFPPEMVSDAISLGVAKFNVGTVLKTEFLIGVHAALRKPVNELDVHTVLGSHREGDAMLAGKERMMNKVREFIRLYGSSGKAST